MKSKPIYTLKIYFRLRCGSFECPDHPSYLLLLRNRSHGSTPCELLKPHYPNDIQKHHDDCERYNIFDHKKPKGKYLFSKVGSLTDFIHQDVPRYSPCSEYRNQEGTDWHQNIGNGKIG